MGSAADSQRKIRQVAGYRFLTRIAVGGVGIVWKAVHRDSQEAVAIKLLRPELVEDREARGGFEREFKVAKDFSHEFLLRYIDQGQLGRTPYLMMEYFPSVTLKACLGGDKTCPIFGKAGELIGNLAGALRYIHERGVIHRDIKPDNVLVDTEGRVKLIDFSVALSGISRWLPFGRKVAGTPSYMAPEQIRKGAATTATDIYALGATVFELLAGRPPFIGESQDDLLNKHLNEKPRAVSHYNRRVSGEMDKLVEAMLAKEPAERPGDAGQIVAKLKRIRVFSP